MKRITRDMLPPLFGISCTKTLGNWDCKYSQFQYFHEEEVISFIKGCAANFPQGEMLFDTTSESGLKFTNWFIKRTGNTDTIMYFGINDSQAFPQNAAPYFWKRKPFSRKRWQI